MKPTGKACAKCLNEMVPCEGHLENVYDWLISKGWDEQAMIEYCLNRQLALNRDNGRSRKGELPKHEYQSQITKHKVAVEKAKARVAKRE